MAGHEGYESGDLARNYGTLLAHLAADTHWRQFIDIEGNLTNVQEVDTFPMRLAEKPWFCFAGLSADDAETISDEVRNTLQNEVRREYLGPEGAGDSRLEAIFRLGSQAVRSPQEVQTPRDYRDLRDLKGMIGKWLDTPMAGPGVPDPLVEKARSALLSYGIDTDNPPLCSLAFLGSPEEVMYHLDERLRNRGITARPEED